MTATVEEMVAWVDRLPPAEADEIARRVIAELIGQAEHEDDARDCAIAYRGAVQVG